jgi:hypothetical protein
VCDREHARVRVSVCDREHARVRVCDTEHAHEARRRVDRLRHCFVKQPEDRSLDPPQERLKQRRVNTNSAATLHITDPERSQMRTQK